MTENAPAKCYVIITGAGKEEACYNGGRKDRKPMTWAETKRLTECLRRHGWPDEILKLIWYIIKH